MSTPYNKPSGQAHKIKVQSNLIYALWNCGIAHADTEAPFIVKTALVGEGAEIKIKLKDDKGKTLEKKSDKIHGNCYRGSIGIPENVRMDAMLYLEVELPKNGLNGESNQVPAGPAIKAKSMKWSQTEVKRGDVVKMQAEFIDLPDKTEAIVRVYEYDQAGNNDPVVSIPTEIKGNKLEVQWEYQYHDDTIQIPTQDDLQPYSKNYQQPQYFFVVDIEGALLGTKQESGLLKFKDEVMIRLLKEDGEPCANAQYTLHMADGTQQDGTADGNGIVELQKNIPGPYVIELKEFEILENKSGEKNS
jgi:hypothetical protein